MSSVTHIRGLAPGQHSSEETSQRWRAVGGTVSDLTGPGTESQTSRTHGEACNDCANLELVLFR